jgi:hypothetical protein
LAVLTARDAATPAGRRAIAEVYRFMEENPADSKVFFRIRVNFRDLTAASGAGGAHGVSAP